jgi:hypothetical protein
MQAAGLLFHPGGPAAAPEVFIPMPPRKPKPPKPPTPKVNPWDPPFARTADANEDDIFKAVGKALTNWEFVEEALARIFAALVGTVAYPRAGPAVRAYGSIISFRSRVEMIEWAGDAFFSLPPPSQFQSDLYPLMTECKDWSQRRNDIAHGRVWPSPDLGGYLLFPSLYNTKKQKLFQPPAFCYSSKGSTSCRRRFRTSLVDFPISPRS